MPDPFTITMMSWISFSGQFSNQHIGPPWNYRSALARALGCRRHLPRTRLGSDHGADYNGGADPMMPSSVIESGTSTPLVAPCRQDLGDARR
jgi:hypothetical protein